MPSYLLLADKRSTNVEKAMTIHIEHLQRAIRAENRKQSRRLIMRLATAIAFASALSTGLAVSQFFM